MHSLNLLFYSQLFFLEQKKDSLKKDCQKNNYQFINYKIESDNCLQVIEKLKQELFTNSFFFNKKIIFIENISLLFLQKDISFWLDYIEKPNPNIIMYITAEKDNFPVHIRNKINKIFNEEKVINLSEKDLISYVSDLFKKDNFFIEKKIIPQLIQKTNGNLFLLNEEIKKIKLYHHSDRVIFDMKLIDKLVYSEEEQNIFSLIYSIIDIKNPIDGFLIFKEMMKQKTDVFLIIHQILKKLQELIIVKTLINKKKSQKEIAFILNFPPAKIYYLTKESQTLNKEKITNLFLSLLDLSYQIKKGVLDPKIHLEMFFMKKIFI
ncbi:MAG: DNA polymerase III subunit delta [Candidatus Phytoplasma pruni]|uniref:DNA polymerase III subunit delta n=1 Tax=Milkweed yellows phytoplasma TaxID=208434 RepID=UPI00036C1335|nr:DNA polymerase III subunit delta [Milkweed yellows phytoplasma]